ncbi:MAG: 4Fe-4S cluster-binding domain-containing protein [Candidatus Falkowbacteria bacterium]|nr:4Fe-4S cluster-binding domain-containing protein [Candidatus Falkowbacteria bacterium]
MFFKLDAKTNGVVAKAVCGKYPPGEIVIRSAYCNFNCVPCFAAGYSHIKKIEGRKSEDIVEIKDFNDLITDFRNFIENKDIKEFIYRCNPPEFNWLRIVGGEPILNADNLTFLLKFLMGVSNYTDKFGARVIIQTNGLFLGAQKYEDIEPIFNLLDGFRGKIVFEISVKGGNRKEFSITSKRREDDYPLIFNCIEHLKKINKKFPNIDFVAIAGFGPNKRFLQGNQTGSKITLYDFVTKQPFYHSTAICDKDGETRYSSKYL